MINAFTAVSAEHPLIAYMSNKKKKYDPNVPKNFSEACEYPGWCKAIDREYNALVQRNTWRYVKRTSDMKPVPFTWVFKSKQIDSEGKKFLEKARCCLRGDRQKPDIDFNPEALYAPVATHESIRVQIACSAGERKTFIEGADIDNAYLYGKLDIPIIMDQPTDSSQQLAKPGYVCELIRSLYGTRQAGEIWGSHLDKTLKQWGFKVSNIDNRVYFLLQGGEFLMLAIVVDDIAFSSNSPFLMQKLKSKLSATFSVKHFGQLKSFVG